MKKIFILIMIALGSVMPGESLGPWAKALEKLTPQERAIVVDKATERPYTGEYLHLDDKGVYHCKVCDAPLYKSDDKFNSSCGWPSFDDAIPGAVQEIPDADGRRTEIVCARCKAHLGHVFRGEELTSKNTRHCVNSLSMKFEKDQIVQNTKKAYFAGGCFWGVEYYLEKLDGVKDVISGFMGGHLENPTYKEVVYTDTGHYEAVEVTYDPLKISYEELAKNFFEIHDPTQQNGQGPDIGEQYRSAIFVSDDEERETIKKLIALLKQKGYAVATQILPKSAFYSAEEYHQDYYTKHGKEPYCHSRVKRF